MRSSAAEIRDASRLLFSAFLSRMSQPDVDALCEEWQESCEWLIVTMAQGHDGTFVDLCDPVPVSIVPCLQPPVSDDKAPLALSLLGLIATERYKMLSPS